MAHWAEVNQDNQVIRVVVGDNNDPAGDEGYSWLIKKLGGTWIQTSFNTQGGVHSLGGTQLRKNYASIGFTYDPEVDAFIPPKPFESWILNEDTGLWEAPIVKPDGNYVWDEAVVNWLKVQGE